MDFQNTRTLVGQILMDYGVITPEQLEKLVKQSIHSNKKIGECIIESGFASKLQLDAALNDQQRRRDFLGS